PDPEALCVDLVRVPDPETVDYRAHLDLATESAAHQAELVARLTGLGARTVDIGQGDVPWTVMADPEGNVFCVLEPRELYRDTGAVAAVVVDCADPYALAAFWGEAAGWQARETREDLLRLRAPENVGPYLEFFRREPGATPLRHRFHLDA
ncbi:VOC family protein, partial [Streptomyces sp. SID11233]|nr:VOC family protein [Streptomyces sp. SID11233]